jgi:hypothetical protein
VLFGRSGRSEHAQLARIGVRLIGPGSPCRGRLKVDHDCEIWWGAACFDDYSGAQLHLQLRTCAIAAPGPDVSDQRVPVLSTESASARDPQTTLVGLLTGLGPSGIAAPLGSH